MLSKSHLHPKQIANQTVSRDISDPNHEIIREPLFGGGERFVLPHRQLGELKKYGWVPFGFGVFTTLFMMSWIGGPLAIGVGFLMKGQLHGLLLVAFSFLGVMGLRFALLLLAGGWAALNDKTRTVVEIRGDRIRTIEEFYRLKWKRKCKLVQVDKLHYKTKWDGKQHDNMSADEWEELSGALVATQGDKEPFLVAFAYSRELLLALAESLAVELDTAQVTNASFLPSTNSSRLHSRTVEVVEENGLSDEFEPVTRPNDTDLRIEHHDAGIKLELPPTGFWKSITGKFSIIWLSFSTFLFSFMLFADGGANDQAWEAWIVPLVFVLFEGVGIAMFLYGLNAGRRRTSVVTAGERLLLISESIFGKKRKEWSKDQLYQIRVGDSNVSVNDQPVQELQFHLNSGEKFGCLLERTEKELNWIAFELNNAFGMAPVSGRPIQLAEVLRDANGLAIPNPNSSIEVEHQGDTTTIRVPRRGFRKFIGPAITGIFMVLICVGVGTAFAWHEQNILEVFIPLLFCALVALGGIASVFATLVLSRRTFEFEANPNSLQVHRTGWLSNKSMHWNRANLKSVKVTTSGAEINGRPLKHLKIIGKDRRSFSGMTDHSIEDLWLVEVAINERLALESATPPQ